jgi:Zn-dependent protease
VPILLDPNTAASHLPRDASAAPSIDEDKAIALAKAPPPSSQSSPTLLIALSVVAFVLLGRGSQTLEQLACLVAVLFFHECGHVLGMRVFGYRDLRIFFVPFVGALASGRKTSAPGWQSATVLLLGPLPGLALSLVLLTLPATGIWRALAFQLMFINGLNLLPLVPLDGGRFVQQLFAAHPRVQATFSALGLSLFGALSLAGGNWIMTGVTAFFLMMVPVQLRIAKAGAALRGAWKTTPPLSELSDAAARDLYARARELTSAPSPQPSLLASLMRQIHERASSEPVGSSAAVAFVAVYLAGFGVIFADLWLVRFVR